MPCPVAIGHNQGLEGPCSCSVPCFRCCRSGRSRPSVSGSGIHKLSKKFYSQTSPAGVTPRQSVKAASTHASKGSGPLIYMHDSVAQLAAVKGLIWTAAWPGSTSLKR